jgi:hypothetical protein
MSTSIGSLSSLAGVQSGGSFQGAALEKSLDVERQKGQEAVDLIQSATQVGDEGGRLLNVYA